MEHFKIYTLLDGPTGENLLKNSGKLHKFDETLPTSAAHYDEVERLSHEWGRNLLLKSNETNITQGVGARWSDLQEKTWREI